MGVSWINVQLRDGIRVAREFSTPAVALGIASGIAMLNPPGKNDATLLLFCYTSVSSAPTVPSCSLTGMDLQTVILRLLF